MLLEKLSAIALFAGAKATGLLAFVGGGIALRSIEQKGSKDQVPAGNGAAEEAPAASSERIITVPAEPAGPVALWQKLERISGEAEDAAWRASAVQREATEELERALRDLEQLRREIAALPPPRDVA